MSKLTDVEKEAFGRIWDAASIGDFTNGEKAVHDWLSALAATRDDKALGVQCGQMVTKC